MRRTEGQSEDEVLYRFVSKEKGEEIETALCRDRGGKLHLSCRRSCGKESDTVRIPDLGRREDRCLAFARAVAESHTDPRILPELWEEFEA